jgi:flagellar biosynthesis protein FlhB
VALAYDASKMRSPTVVAKGKLMIADEIKKIARENNVPVIENQPLAQELFKTTKVGREIPGDLYQAVAEVLAFVYKIRKERDRKKKESLGPERGRKPLQTASRS